MRCNPSNVGLLFPGQGSYDPGLLTEVRLEFPETEDAFSEADRVCERFLGFRVTPVFFAAKKEEHDRLAAECRDIDQIGIFLASYLVAGLLRNSGLYPGLMLGHSFGEIAALVSADAISLTTGLKVVCQRVHALQRFAQPGGMMAVACDSGRVLEAIKQLNRPGPFLAVINHARQSVVSGTSDDLQALANTMNRAGVSTTLLRARYPFHSPLLADCVSPFRYSLLAHEFGLPTTPVYFGTAQRWLVPGCDLPSLIAEQFVTPLNFPCVVDAVIAAGSERFVECGAGGVVTRIVKAALSTHPNVIALPAVASEGLRRGLSAINENRELRGGNRGPENAAADSAQDALARLAHKAAVASQAMQESITEMTRLVGGYGLEANGAVISEADALSPATICDDRRVESSILESSNPESSIEEECSSVPIAVVAAGCVLPGASSVAQFWSNVEQGVSGIVDLAKADQLMAADYLVRDENGEIKIQPDKTYTLLHGSVGKLDYDARLLALRYSREEFEALTRGEKILCLALAEGLDGLDVHLPAKRIQCILGATADGSEEYDEARFMQGVNEIVQSLDEVAEAKTRFSSVVRQSWSEAGGSLSSLAQHESYQRVCTKMLGMDVDTYIVDAACSSSLYAMNLGMKALESGQADLVIAGGVFAPGPANNALFAQFRGLTPSQSRPFDAAADGVVFGDGAAILALKRLPDAISARDKVAGVIRGMGLSSDGKSPATNVPQAKGQSLAIRRAYDRTKIDPATIQYVEAHATATPVGDAVEFSAIASAFPLSVEGAPIELGSVKALIGHTGWAAGAASVIKICKAFERQTVPAQFNYEAPGPQINLSGSPFVISKNSHAWPRNKNGLPRRAAINGFGFGGTDAHLVLEEFEPSYHARICSRIKPMGAFEREFAIVGFGSLFPHQAMFAGDSPCGVSRFKRDQMHLPKGKRLLPDVIDHTDPSQFLALLAASDALSALPDGWRSIAGETAIVLGIESKTERGTGADERIFRDRLYRLVNSADIRGSSNAETDRLLEKVIAVIDRRNLPSNAYTLPGLMPNVATGRVANLFDLNGPNVVVDKGRRSLAQALTAGVSFLQHGDCKMVLAGALHAAAHAQDGTGEAVLLLAVTTFAEAQNQGFAVLGVLDLAASDSSSRMPGALDLRGAEGAIEIAAEMREARLDNRLARIHIPATPSESMRPIEPAKTIHDASAERTKNVSQVYQYVQGTPISRCSPKLVAAPAERPALSLKGRRILFLTDDPAYWRGLEDSGALLPFDYAVLCAPGARLHYGVEVDLDCESETRETLAGLVGKFDTILAIKTLENATASGFLESASHATFPFLDLLFAACRGFYSEIREERVSVLSLCLDAFRSDELHPYTGLIAGFIKSIARECRESSVRALNAEERSFLSCIRYIETELGQAPAVEETCIRGQKRHTIQLALQPEASKLRNAYMDADSVVIATGGGRGVTAVMVEELLTRFGCKVIAVGRTDPSAAPPHILEMDDNEFAAYESRFYAEQLKSPGAKKILELKLQYAAFLAARELNQVRATCESLPGSYEYVCLDITNERSVTALVNDIYRKHGHVDLILHGAGVQISQAIPKRSLNDFRKVVNTKLASLGLLHAACTRRQTGHPLHVHILTSAFSYMGNDGQPDYGAANEALNRLAINLCGSAETGVWSSMAWLGWAGIGMTRGSEYAALAASRRLRGVTREEGRALFAEAIAGVPSQPVTIQIAEGEVAHYGVVFAPAAQADETRLPAVRHTISNRNSRGFHSEREVSLHELPFLSDHRVNGAPTLPGAFLIAEIGAFAMMVRPDLKIAAFENASFHRFVRIPEDRPRSLRLEGHMLEEGAEHALLNVKVYADFVHRSGAVLQKDVLQTEVTIRFASSTTPAIKNGFHRDRHDGLRLDDPYVMDGSPVSLKGKFRTMSNIVSGFEGRHADYALDTALGPNTDSALAIPKIMMMDSLWRFGAIVREPDNSMPVYVPVKCDVMRVHFDFADSSSAPSLNKLIFCGANPTSGEDSITIGPVAALDSSGQVLLVVEGGVCRRYGTVDHAGA